MTVRMFVVVLVGGLLAFSVAFAALAIAASRHWGRVSCESFARQTGRPTKFVVYNALNTGDCLTPSGNGTWIPTKNLREFGAAP